MSWNIKTPGDYINGPLTVAGSATITGDLTVDTNVLKVDTTNDRVGIGTASPANKLEVVAPAGDNIVSTFRSGDATAANNAGGGFRSISSATAASRVAQVWLDADGADLSGGDYFFIQKNGNSGTVEFNQFSNAAMTFLTNGTERARIDSSGNVGVGVTPSVNSLSASGYRGLEVGSVKGFGLYCGNSEAYLWSNLYYDGGLKYANSNTAAASFYQNGGQFIWYNAPNSGASGAGTAATLTPRMTLDASGNLLVGKTANYGAGETQTLQLKSSVIFASDNTANAANRNWSIGTNVSGAGNMEWVISSTNTGIPNFAYRMQITSAGDVNNTTGTYGTISDLRLKENISDARNYLADLLKLRVVKYSLKEESSAVATKLGFIAQEVELVFPNLVDQSDKEYDGAEGIRSVKTSILIPMLLKAIQELTARVQTLEAR
jgi:hypothetical protein